MKLESEAYTLDDLHAFLDQQQDRERMALADRLEKASNRLATIAAQVEAGHGEDEWSNHEVLAHIAVLSKYYGVLVHRISSGQVTEIDMLSNTRLRDAAGDQMSQLEPADLLQAVLADHARTVKLLRTVDPASLRREATDASGEKYTAEFLARYPLINHLEEHVDQLERSLAQA
jgi:hypothetical protein